MWWVRGVGVCFRFRVLGSFVFLLHLFVIDFLWSVRVVVFICGICLFGVGVRGWIEVFFITWWDGRLWGNVYVVVC